MIGSNVWKNYNDTIELQLILHCAPVLKGIKAANTLTLLCSDLEKVKRMLKDTEIRMIILYQNSEKAVVLFYRNDRMRVVMNQVAYCSYLLQLGYRPLDLEQCFYRLREKMYTYHKIGKVFPHELGVFLEYPLYDIQEFMKQGGKNFKPCGYWKVYEKEDVAKNTFKRYDTARDELLKRYQITGKIV